MQCRPWESGLALDPPVSVSSVAASQPEPKSKSEYNLTQPALRLPVHSDNDLSQLSIWFSPPPPPSPPFWQSDVYVSDLDFYFHRSYLEKKQSIFTQTISKHSQTALAGLPPNQRLISQYAQVPANIHVQTQLCGLLCFDRPVGVLGPLETSCLWERCVVSPRLLSLIFCFVFVSLIETFSEPDEDHCSID